MLPQEIAPKAPPRNVDPRLMQTFPRKGVSSPKVGQGATVSQKPVKDQLTWTKQVEKLLAEALSSGMTGQIVLHLKEGRIMEIDTNKKVRV